MDPQQRGMLEAVYKALENGESYPGSSALAASSHLPPRRSRVGSRVVVH